MIHERGSRVGTGRNRSHNEEGEKQLHGKARPPDCAAIFPIGSLREGARPPHALCVEIEPLQHCPFLYCLEKTVWKRRPVTFPPCKLSSFHNLLRIMVLLPPLRPALICLHSAFQFLIRLQVIQTDHLIAARRWTFLFCKSIKT